MPHRAGRINETSGVWPLVDVAPPALADRGFHMALQTEHFTLWIRHVDHSVSQRTTNVNPGGV